MGPHRVARCSGSCYIAEYSELLLMLEFTSDFIAARPKSDRCAVVRAPEQEAIRYDRRG